MALEHRKIEYQNEMGESIEFSIFSPFVPDKVEGLNGIKNNLITNKGVNQNGITLIATNFDARNITIQGGIVENITDNRDKIIRVCNPHVKGKLIYTKGDIERYVDCVIEEGAKVGDEFNPSFFISFYCPDPFWKTNAITEALASWIKDWTFAWRIPSTGFTFGHREKSLIHNIYNKNFMDIGMDIEFKALGHLKNPSLLNLETREFIKINRVMEAGQIIKITTHYNKKKVELIDGTKTKNVINDIDWESTFLQLHHGDNNLRYDAEENINNLELTINYQENYLGV